MPVFSTVDDEHSSCLMAVHRFMPQYEPCLESPQQPARPGPVSVTTGACVVGRHPNKSVDVQNLGWVLRYARHCGFSLGDGRPVAQTLRLAFGAAAWRVLCRSPKERFLPILRNQDLSFSSLVTYCQRLAERSFIRAPQAVLLGYFVTQRRAYFNRPCDIPSDTDYDLMRVADRVDGLTLSAIALVTNWSYEIGLSIRPQHRWSALVRRAQAFHDQQRMKILARQQYPWHFFCRVVPWRGFEIHPLTTSSDMWFEGAAQGSCLYKLSAECRSDKSNRFFSIRKDGRRVATLELVWTPPQEGFHGVDRVLGQWQLQDIRLSYNRLVDRPLMESMKAFAWTYNLWSQRPRRMPRGYAEDVSSRISRHFGWPHSSHGPRSFAKWS